MGKIIDRESAVVTFNSDLICKAIEKAYSMSIRAAKEDIISILEEALNVVGRGLYRFLWGSWWVFGIIDDSYSGSVSKSPQILPVPICVRLLDMVYRESAGKFRKIYLRRPQDRSENGSSVKSYPVVTVQ